MLSESCLSRFSNATGNKATSRLCRASWIGRLNVRGGALGERRLRYFAQDDELLMRIFRAQPHDLAMCLFERHHRCNRTSGRIAARRLATKNCKFCDHRATCLILSCPGSIRSYAGAHHMPSTLPRRGSHKATTSRAGADGDRPASLTTNSSGHSSRNCGCNPHNRSAWRDANHGAPLRL